jgi:small subunit ribosomal protein S20
MANTKQAKKRAAQNVRHRTRNRSVKTRTRNVVREFRATAASDAAKAAEQHGATVSELDVAVRKGVLHKRTASRLKSRIAKTLNKAQAATPSAKA